MEKTNKAKIEAIQDLLVIQGSNGNWNFDPYMQGLYNGLEIAYSIIVEKEPEFRNAPKVWLNKKPGIITRILWKIIGMSTQ